MPARIPATGFTQNGLPYNKVGRGPRPLVIFQGLLFDNKPLPAHMNWLYQSYYRYLEKEYTTYIVLRKRGLPHGYTLQEMAGDYADFIRKEFGGPVDVWGVSTGGSIVQHFAADYPGLVRRLIIHSAAFTLSDSTKSVMLAVRDLAQQRKWPEAYAKMMSTSRYSQATLWIGSRIAGAFFAAEDPSDLVVTIEAEDRFNFQARLGEIHAPTLVVAGEKDPFYSPALFQDTAAGIPGARLVLYPRMGHPAGGKQFRQDVLGFLSARNTEVQT
jgi:pimeloyl-ACP methyl ester carboxylesterase